MTIDVRSQIIRDDLYNNVITPKRVVEPLVLRRPGQHEFVRVVGGDDFNISPVALFEFRTGYEEVDTYLLTHEISAHESFNNDFIPVKIVLAVNSDGHFFLWPLKLLDKKGKPNDWYASAIDVAELAKIRWIKMTSNMDKKRYEAVTAEDDFDLPDLPVQNFNCILQASLSGMVIDSLNHPIAKKIRGAK